MEKQIGKNNELKQIEITIVDKYDMPVYYTAVVHYKNATRDYVLDLLKKQGKISISDRAGFNKYSGNIITFNGQFKPVDSYNKNPADSIRYTW